MNLHIGTSRRCVILMAVAVLCAAGIAVRFSQSLAAAAPSAERRVLYYVDPMHPSYSSAQPGKAPDCGMALTPVYQDPQSSPPNGLRLTARQEQALQIETETVEVATFARRLRSTGRVAPDEGLTYRVSAGVDGWVRRVYSDRTGSRVKRGQPLAAYYSKDLSSPQQAYVYALESFERLNRMPSPPADQLALARQQLATAADNLRFVGMGDPQIEELARTRGETLDIDLAAPAAGRILERHMAVGQRFMKGELLYLIANLERVWVLTDVYPEDLAVLGGAARAQVRTEGLPPFAARVAAALPQFDGQGRAGKLRLEVHNPDGRLLPGMIVSVDFEVPARPAMTVPAAAVLDTGTTRRVFVATGRGQYEPRQVETGFHEGDGIEIRHGLKSGDRVVTAGGFLLDSETRLRATR